MKSPRSLIRPQVRKLHAYVPGEQPRDRKLIKLNTNENPYPPAPQVLEAVRKAADARLRLYPDPTARPLREALARRHHCAPENIIIGNGSDELLALATRAFVEPKSSGRSEAKSKIQYFVPSYSLYPVLADIHGAIKNEVPLNSDFSLPSPNLLRKDRRWDFQAVLSYITTPNAPTGRGYSTSELESLCRRQQGVVILDEAYVDFAEENAAELALKLPRVIVSRTFSKAYSLCFQRVGYFLGHPELIAALDKIRDSYNVNGLGQIAAREALQQRRYYRNVFKTIIEEREKVSRQMTLLGFRVLPSRTNFILVRPLMAPAKTWLEKLRNHGILVRWFDGPEIRQYLRITIGTPDQMKRLLRVIQRILNER